MSSYQHIPQTQDPYVDLQSTDPETAVTFEKYADIPSRFSSALKRFVCCHPIFPNNAQRLICLKQSDTVQQLLETYFHGRVKAIPVIDEHRHPKKVVTQQSLLKLLLPFLSEYQKNQHGANLQQFLQKTIDDISELLQDPIILTEDSTAYDAFQLMQKYPYQRILIVNDLQDNILTNLVSETRLVEVLSAQVDDMESAIKNTKVEKIALNKDECLCDLVHGDITAMEAFLRLSKKNLQSLAVVDENGKILCVVTPSDIKGIGADFKGLSLLQEPVQVYLQHIQKSQEMEQMKPNVIACHLSDSIHHLLKKFAYWKVHRVFVTTEEDRYVTDLTLLDVMLFFQQCEHKIGEKYAQHSKKSKELFQ